MIKETIVTINTKWECQGCGRCCHLIGEETTQKLFGEKTKEDGACPRLIDGRCSDYDQRPLGCKMYPFYPDWEKLKIGHIDFSLESLKIDADCPGYMKGTHIFKNKKLLKKLDKVALQLKQIMIKNPKGKIKDLFSIN